MKGTRGIMWDGQNLWSTSWYQPMTSRRRRRWVVCGVHVPCLTSWQWMWQWSGSVHSTWHTWDWISKSSNSSLGAKTIAAVPTIAPNRTATLVDLLTVRVEMVRPPVWIPVRERKADHMDGWIYLSMDVLTKMDRLRNRMRVKTFKHDILCEVLWGMGKRDVLVPCSKRSPQRFIRSVTFLSDFCSSLQSVVLYKKAKLKRSRM